ncbi:MAG: hypothetical protein ACLFTH_00900 [Candidatus Woesearchaeota archaeon]
MADEQNVAGSTLLSEIEELQKKLDGVISSKASSSRPKSPLPHFLPQLLLGSVFFLITLLALSSGNRLLTFGSILPFTITLLSILYACADIFTEARDEYWHLTGGVLVVLTSGLIMLLWERLLSSFSSILVIVFTILLVIETFWFLLHAYLGFLHGKLGRESSITSLLLAGSWILLLSFWLYPHLLLFLLVVIALIIFGKASFDFSKRFVKR